MRNVLLAVLLVPFAVVATAARAQNFPDKAVTMIAPFPAGGSVDLVARAVAQQMSELWKQPVVVANRPGAGGNIGAEAVARAARLRWRAVPRCIRNFRTIFCAISHQ